ncbi:MAG: hypothetical protein ACYDDP_09040 [Acidithiobacillus sp.]
MAGQVIQIIRRGAEGRNKDKGRPLQETGAINRRGAAFHGIPAANWALIYAATCKTLAMMVNDGFTALMGGYSGPIRLERGRGGRHQRRCR